MKSLTRIVLLFLVIFGISHHAYSSNAKPILKGPYIGQQPPGLTPTVFAPEGVSNDFRNWGGNFTPDMQAYYFGRKHFKTGKTTRHVYKLEDGQWQESEIEQGGNLSPDGKTMFSGRHYRHLTKNGWSALTSLGPAFEAFRIMRLSGSSKGTYVFDEATKNGNGKLRFSRLINGKRQTPQVFAEHINTGKWTAHPFIAPDESYLIWDSERADGYGSSDMYISFRQPNGSWGKAINFGDQINTEGEDGGGYVTPDGKYLLFCRRCAPPNFEIMWVDAQIIERLKHSNKQQIHL